jgi:predicted permease
MTNLAQDLKYALRSLRKSPGFAAAAILVMALGIGANSAIFSVVNAVLLRPLPFHEPDKLVQVWHIPPPKQFPGLTRFSVSPANYLDWKRMNHVFSDMSIYGFQGLTLGGDRPQSITAGTVETNFFNILGVRPAMGRAFTADEGQIGRDREVILSHKLWRDAFGEDRNIVGREVEFNGMKYTVIGVMGPQFSVPTFAQAWTPLAMDDHEKSTRGIHDYLVIGRLKPGVSIEQANAELAQISQALAREYPVDDTGWGAMSTPLREELVGDVRPALLVLLGAVVFVLLIACANVANLLLARTLAKRHEIAIRVALGADRRRLLQQILSESVMVSFLGGLLGLVLAKFGIALIVGFLSDSLPRATEIGIDRWVLAFTLIVSLLTGMASGLFPALRFAGKDASEGLKEGVGRAGTESGGSKTRSALVVAEVSLSLLLLIGAGLMIRTLHKLQTMDAGFDTKSSLVLNLKFPENSYSSQTAYNQAVNQMLEDVRRIPGVTGAGMINDLPLTGGSHQPIQAEGHPVVQMSEQPEVAVRSVTDGYMKSMGIAIVQGRDLSPSDTTDRSGAIVISQGLAKQLWPNENALGKHITLTFMPERGPREVVGIVGDVKQDSITAPETNPSLYVPIGQSDVPTGSKWTPRDMWIVVHTTSAKPTDLAPTVMAAIHNVNASVPIIDVMSIKDFVNEILQAQRMNMALLVAFAALALTLATIGIYSVLAYTVRRRVREIGIRLALGAQIRDIIQLIVVQGMKPVIVGVVLGIALSFGLGKAVASMVYGVSTADMMSLLGGSMLLLVVSVLASLVPAMRATRVQPVEILRQE